LLPRFDGLRRQDIAASERPIWDRNYAQEHDRLAEARARSSGADHGFVLPRPVHESQDAVPFVVSSHTNVNR
jgi:hypothetical protein